MLALNINPFPTIEQLEEGVEQAITDQKPLVIIVDDLTGKFLLLFYFILVSVFIFVCFDLLMHYEK